MCLVQERWNDARRSDLAEHIALGVDATALEREQLRRGDDVAFHAVYFLQADDAAPAVLHALDLNYDVDRRRDLRAQRLGREVDAGHGHHILDSPERVA